MVEAQRQASPPAATTIRTSVTHDAPLDPNFLGRGQVFTDEHGNYRFTAILPALGLSLAQPPNAWRPVPFSSACSAPAWRG